MGTLEILQDILMRDYSIKRERLVPDASLDTLGVDSLGLLELMFKIEDRFRVRIPGDTPTNLRTVGDVVVYIDGLAASHSEKSAALAPGLTVKP
jgi:acyl carrier protein